MKIAISGSAGCGKSTLARALSDELGIPVIPEHYDEFFDEKGRYLRPEKRLMKRIEIVLDGKHQAEETLTGFIADRSPIDLFNLWLTRGFSSDFDRSERIQAKCKRYLQKYDMIVFPPWGVLDLRQVEEENSRRKRVMKPWVQFRHHSTMIGVALQWVPVTKILPIPKEFSGLEKRVNFVLGRLSQIE